MHRKIAGLSLVELMVAIGIVGILATLAVPRYHQFMVQARRGEAKSNLSHIISLQGAYKIDYFNYYAGPAMINENGIGYRDSFNRRGVCIDSGNEQDEGLGNWLGFQPAACDELRYLYSVSLDGRTATAAAASDADYRWIYPDCRGGGNGECPDLSAGLGAYGGGDVLRTTVDSKPEVCLNITKYCPEGQGGVINSGGLCTCGGWGGGDWSPSEDTWYPCETKKQERTESRTCTATGTGDCSTVSTTRQKLQYVNGNQSITASTPIADAPCFCDYSNEPRSVCIGCNCTENWSGNWSPRDPTTVDPNTICAGQTEQFTRSGTLACAGSGTDCPHGNIISGSAEVVGTMTVTCDDHCTWGNWSDWFGCNQISAGPPPVCEQSRTRQRQSCTPPCPLNCVAQETETSPCPCTPPPTEKCVEGDSVLIGMEKPYAKNECNSRTPPLNLEVTAVAGGLRCTCTGTPIPTPTPTPTSMCPDGVTTLAKAREDCRSRLIAHTGDGALNHMNFAADNCACKLPQYIYSQCLIDEFSKIQESSGPYREIGQKVHELETNYPGDNCTQINASSELTFAACSCEDFYQFFNLHNWMGMRTPTIDSQLKTLQSTIVSSTCSADRNVTCNYMNSNCCKIPTNLLP